jgi:hypothetical protein
MYDDRLIALQLICNFVALWAGYTGAQEGGTIERAIIHHSHTQRGGKGTLEYRP